VRFGKEGKTRRLQVPMGSDQPQWPQRPPRSGGGGGASALPRRCGGSGCRGGGPGILADADAVGRDRGVMVVVVILGGWAVRTRTRNEDR